MVFVFALFCFLQYLYVQTQTSIAMIIKAEDFKYPSKIERSKALKDFPKLDNFSFPYYNALAIVLKKKKSLADASRIENLFWWNTCLKNRFGKVRETYIFTFTNFLRGFSDDYFQCAESEIVNRIMFDYYAEVFYYYFFSTRDILAQIINVYWRLDYEERRLHFNSTFLNMVPDIGVKSHLSDFIIATESASNIRNTFAHRFTPNHPDYRSQLSEENGNESLALGGGNSISSAKILADIDSSLKALSVLMEKLVVVLKVKENK